MSIEKIELCGYRIIFRYGKSNDNTPITMQYWSNKIYRYKSIAEEALKYIINSGKYPNDMWQWFIVPVHGIPTHMRNKNNNGYIENKELQKYKVET